MSDYILDMIDITKDFPGVRALDKVELHLKPGRVHSLGITNLQRVKL